MVTETSEEIWRDKEKDRQREMTIQREKDREIERVIGEADMERQRETGRIRDMQKQRWGKGDMETDREREGEKKIWRDRQRERWEEGDMERQTEREKGSRRYGET
jgi:hypothetical protein